MNAFRPAFPSQNQPSQTQGCARLAERARPAKYRAVPCWQSGPGPAGPAPANQGRAAPCWQHERPGQPPSSSRTLLTARARTSRPTTEQLRALLAALARTSRTSQSSLAKHRAVPCWQNKPEYQRAVAGRASQDQQDQPRLTSRESGKRKAVSNDLTASETPFF